MRYRPMKAKEVQIDGTVDGDVFTDKGVMSAANHHSLRAKKSPDYRGLSGGDQGSAVWTCGSLLKSSGPY